MGNQHFQWTNRKQTTSKDIKIPNNQQPITKQLWALIIINTPLTAATAVIIILLRHHFILRYWKDTHVFPIFQFFPLSTCMLSTISLYILTTPSTLLPLRRQYIIISESFSTYLPVYYMIYYFVIANKSW